MEPSQDDAAPRRETPGQEVLVLLWLVAGAIAGLVAAQHIGGVMWGDSAYSEASAMWTSDNSGRSRFDDYGHPLLMVVVFTFMFVSVPLATGLATVRKARVTMRDNLSSSVVCVSVFLAGYSWWRWVYAASLGFPQYHLDSQQIHAGYEALSNPLAIVAVVSGTLTLFVGAILGLIRRRAQ